MTTQAGPVSSAPAGEEQSLLQYSSILRTMRWSTARRTVVGVTLLTTAFLVALYVQSFSQSVLIAPQQWWMRGRQGAPSQPLFANVSSDRWIVVTTIAPPTPDVQFLASLQGWRVVVVGDSKTPRDWSYPNCYYLSLEDQEKMGLEIHALVPTKSYARKNFGYLFAIQHGAKVIYETDDDNRPTDRLQGFDLKPRSSGLKFVASTLFNPYWHFGQKTLWPRGYPLSDIGTPQVSNYVLGTWDTPTIQQGVVNGDPDMDAIFRLTRKITLKPLNVTFDPTAPNVILPPGVFAPFNSQNTLFRYDALWAMLLPTTVTFRQCDIWRSYWAQRLLWEVGGTLSFVRPNAFQARNAHDYLKDAIDERTMYWQTSDFVSFLAGWTCPQELSFFDCVIKLTSDMAARDYWKEGDVTLVRAWLRDLVAMGYKSPRRVRDAYTRKNLLDFFRGQPLTGEDVPFDPETSKARVVFHPVEMPPPLLTRDFTQDVTYAQHLRDVRFLQRQCKNATFRLQSEGERQSSVHRRTLLVVEFNFPFYATIGFLQMMRRHRYPTSLFCGEDIAQFQQINDTLPFPATFVEAGVSKGRYGYECIMLAISMGYDVDSYFYVSDDVLFNSEKLDAFGTKTWTPSFMWRNFYTDKWVFWHNKWGRSALLPARRELETMAKTDKDMRHLLDRVNKNHRSHLVNGSQLASMAAQSCGDTFQVSARDAGDFLKIANVYRKHGVFLEIAVPTILSGLHGKEDITVAEGLWTRTKPLETRLWLKEDTLWLHPVKWRLVMRDAGNLAALCRLYFSSVVKPAAAAAGAAGPVARGGGAAAGGPVARGGGAAAAGGAAGPVAKGGAAAAGPVARG